MLVCIDYSICLIQQQIDYMKEDAVQLLQKGILVQKEVTVEHKSLLEFSI